MTGDVLCLVWDPTHYILEFLESTFFLQKQTSRKLVTPVTTRHHLYHTLYYTIYYTIFLLEIENTR